MLRGILNSPLALVTPSIGKNSESGKKSEFITNLTFSPSTGLSALSYTKPETGIVEFNKPSNSPISIRISCFTCNISIEDEGR